MHPVAAFEGVEALLGHFDHVVYALGNSHHHLGALQLLRRRGGAVLAHDVRLSNLYRHLHGDPAMLPGGFEAALAAMYKGEIPLGLGKDGEIATSEIDRYGLLMAREVINRASCYLVNSAFAASLARVDAGPGSTTTILALPFAFSSAKDDAPAFSEEARDAPDALDPDQRKLWGASEPPEATFIAHFGIVDPSKRPELVLEAHAALCEAGYDTLLCFVGPIGDELCAHLSEYAASLGTTHPCDREGWALRLPAMVAECPRRGATASGFERRGLCRGRPVSCDRSSHHRERSRMGCRATRRDSRQGRYRDRYGGARRHLEAAVER